MAAFISASSSQVPSRKEYEVFISFRGSDVRFGFLNHLKNELCRKIINVYVDERLQRGEEISSALVEAIEGSMIALVIFSKDYASSKWCLEELVKIMECKETKQQIVIPVFYDIDPSDVRHQKGRYEEAFTHHEHKFNDNMEKLPIWRSVLKKAADLCGFQAFTHHEQKFNDNMEKLQIWRSVLEKTANLAGYHSLNFRNEPELIDAIVGRVLKILEENSPPRSQPIEFHQNFIRVESLMEVESQEEVRVLGIWGPGGIGKTTLASAIFDKFSSKFESYCFLNIAKI
ncbi:TMV resistance protein N-like [Neltuma alba]|uniref:TMV resistance protein N-like n=1 Tax=Neltuma alba TaxID=207710 RepID=UPI0010A4561E|nr:TMV resistance protein N-like [Prosopis alba]